MDRWPQAPTSPARKYHSGNFSGGRGNFSFSFNQVQNTTPTLKSLKIHQWPIAFDAPNTPLFCFFSRQFFPSTSGSLFFFENFFHVLCTLQRFHFWFLPLSAWLPVFWSHILKTLLFVLLWEYNETSIILFGVVDCFYRWSDRNLVSTSGSTVESTGVVASHLHCLSLSHFHYLLNAYSYLIFFSFFSSSCLSLCKRRTLPKYAAN